MASRDDTRWGYPALAWEMAKAEVEAALVEHARRRETITYADLCAEVRAVHLRPYSWSLMALLDEVCSGQDAAHGTILASLVTRKDTGIPGEGYFKHAARIGRDVRDPRAFWADEIEKVFAVWAEA
ncbi:MAG: hypothetical protein WC971_00210 [Coriobacteriia bacterium]